MFSELVVNRPNLNNALFKIQLPKKEKGFPTTYLCFKNYIIRTRWVRKVDEAKQYYFQCYLELYTDEGNLLDSNEIGDYPIELTYISDYSFQVLYNGVAYVWKIDDNKFVYPSSAVNIDGHLIHTINVNTRVVYKDSNFFICDHPIIKRRIPNQITCALFDNDKLLFTDKTGICSQLDEPNYLFKIPMDAKYSNSLWMELNPTSYYFPEEFTYIIKYMIEMTNLLEPHFIDLFDTRYPKTPYFTCETDSVLIKNKLIYTLNSEGLRQINLHGEILSVKKENTNLESLYYGTMQVHDNYIDLFENHTMTRYA